VRAWLAGYAQAIEDFGAYAASASTTRRRPWRRLLRAVRDRA